MIELRTDTFKKNNLNYMCILDWYLIKGIPFVKMTWMDITVKWLALIARENSVGENN